MPKSRIATTRIRLNKLPQLSLTVSIIALVVSISLGVTSLVMTWHIYSTGTRPQTDFQRTDVELQRLKEKLDDETQLISKRRAEGFDVTERENALQQANAYYSDAWNAWLQHDYTQAEELILDANRTLPKEMRGPTFWFLLPLALGTTIVVVALFFIMKRFVVVERVEEEEKHSS